MRGVIHVQSIGPVQSEDQRAHIHRLFMSLAREESVLSNM